MVKARVRKSSSYTVTETSFTLPHQGWLATRFNQPSPKPIHDCDGAEVFQDGHDCGSVMAYLHRLNFPFRYFPMRSAQHATVRRDLSQTTGLARRRTHAPYSSVAGFLIL